MMALLLVDRQLVVVTIVVAMIGRQHERRLALAHNARFLQLVLHLIMIAILHATKRTEHSFALLGPINWQLLLVVDHHLCADFQIRKLISEIHPNCCKYC